MTLEGFLVVSLYTVVLMVIGAWGAGFCFLPLLRHWRSGNCPCLSAGAWWLLGTAPFWVGFAVGCASLLSAGLKTLSVLPDHCGTHHGHPHLCWTGVHALMPQGPLFWTILSAAVGLFAVSLVRVGYSLRMNRKLLLAEYRMTEEGFREIPSQVPAAFVAGILRPRAYLTRAASQLLSSGERRIVALHEQEHIRRRDPLKLTSLRIGASLFPGFRWIEEKWKEEAEIECDRACLAHGAAPEEVSLTLLKLARSIGAHSGRSALAYAWGSEAVLRRRVESMLLGVQPAAPRISWNILVIGLLIPTVFSLALEHHVMETVLGWFAG